jgi:CDP-diacylglycerol pyrophosphatase
LDSPASGHLPASGGLLLLPMLIVCVAGKIEFGVINQSSSAFNHILNDVSLVVYQVTNNVRPCPLLRQPLGEVMAIHSFAACQ